MANRSPVSNDRAFYQRKEVQRLIEIFGKPKPPKGVYQQQFDGNQEKLQVLAAKRWHELDHTVFSPFLLDMVYMPLQYDLFMYLFPAILIRWDEYLQTYDWNRDLKSEASLYRAIVEGDIFNKVIPRLADDVLDWMAEAYACSLHDIKEDQLTASFSVFNALGQSCNIAERIWNSISLADTRGKCRWLLSFYTGLTMAPELAAHYAPPIYFNVFHVVILSSGGDIYDTGYLEENKLFMESTVTFDNVQMALKTLPEEHLSAEDRIWVGYLLEYMSENVVEVKSRISRYLWYLDQPQIGFPSASLERS